MRARRPRASTSGRPRCVAPALLPAARARLPRTPRPPATALLLLAVSCTAVGDGHPATGRAAPAPTPDPVDPAVAAPAFEADPPSQRSADRRCGEPGELPTELPPALVAGRNPAGATLLKPDETRTVGTVKLHYDRSAWVGTMRAGFHAPALRIEIDRAEVGEHDPWGTQVELHPDTETHADVGPYRFDIRIGAGDPPAEVTVRATREVCPASAVHGRATGPRSLWVSTEGIRLHTFDLQGELLQLAVDAHGDAPRFDVSNLDYRHWFEPRPGVRHVVRLSDSTVTLDRVVPGPGARFTDRWEAEGDARVHVRARVEPTARTPFPAPVAATTPCGDPSPVRTERPTALGTLPPVVQDRTLDVLQTAAFGALELKYITLDIPARGGGPYREEAESIPHIQIFGGLLGGLGLTAPARHGPHLTGLGHELLRVEAAPGGPPDRVRVRRIALACPKDHPIPALADPAYLWLGTVGHRLVSIKGASPIPVTLQLFVDLDGPSLGFASEHAHVTRRLRPDVTGAAYSLEGYLVEVVEVLPGVDTTFDGQRYVSSALAPVVHVQLKVTPQPGP